MTTMELSTSDADMALLRSEVDLCGLVPQRIHYRMQSHGWDAPKVSEAIGRLGVGT